MSGHNAGRPRRWPWAVLCFLFAMTFAFAIAQVGGVWSMIRIVSAVGLGISLLVLILKSLSARRHARRETAETGTEGQPSEEQPTEERVRTYEEVFGLAPDLDEGGLPSAPEEEWPSEGETEMEAEGQPSAEQPPAEEPDPTPEDDAESLQADLEEEVDQVESVDADGSQEQLRRMREEFRARAEAAALRVKQREDELQEAASVADQER